MQLVFGTVELEAGELVKNIFVLYGGQERGVAIMGCKGSIA